MVGSGGGVPKLELVGFGDGDLDIVIFILGAEAARSFAAKVLLRVEDLEADAARAAVDEVFARPRRGAACSGGGGGTRCCSGDVMETAKLSSLPMESLPAKPGGDAMEAMTSGGAVGGVAVARGGV